MDTSSTIAQWLANKDSSTALEDETVLKALVEAIRVRDEQARLDGYFASLSGHPCYLLAPERSHIAIEDIALSLARKPRWGALSKSESPPLTVAQHSVMVSYLCSEPNALLGLLHDAAEAYLSDVISPLKSLLGATYKELERDWAAAIGRRLEISKHGFSPTTLAYLPADVKIADLICLELERHELLERGELWSAWGSTVRPDLEMPEILDELESYQAFMARYAQLTATKG